MNITQDREATNDEPPQAGVSMRRSTVFLETLFLFAGFNALSFFILTEYPWRRLTGGTAGVLIEESAVRIGFPLPFKFQPGVGLVAGEQWSAFGGNIMCALVVAIAYAAFLGIRQDSSEVEASGREAVVWQWQFRFRLTHLLFLTTITAVLLGIFSRAPDPSLRAIKLIYLGGPCLIVWVFYSLSSWPQLRLWCLFLVVTLLAGGAANFASDAFGDFTYGLFGLFVCWLPQMLLIIALLLISQHFKKEWQAVERSE